MTNNNNEMLAVLEQLQKMENDTSKRFDNLTQKLQEQKNELIAVKKDLEKTNQNEKKNEEFEDGGGELVFDQEDKDASINDVGMNEPKDGT